MSPSAPHTSTTSAITGLHHVGHVVRDMGAAIARYRRLGFHMPPATYPALAPHEGAEPRAFGAGNTHALFRGSFLEVATVVDGDAEPDEEMRLHPLQVPPEALPRLTETIERTAARLRGGLSRFEGLHILAFSTPDADAAAARLTADGIGHGGVQRLQRPVDTTEGTRMERIGYLELDDAPGRTPEGRLAVAENPPDDVLRVQTGLDHPNGALGLAEAVLCVPDAELDTYARRYAAYLRVAGAGDGSTRAFGLGGSRLTVVAGSGLADLVPGAKAPALPAFVAFAVAVADLDATRAHLRRHAVTFTDAPDGDVHVSAEAAQGPAVIFRSCATGDTP